MRIDIATLFTDMCDSVLHESIVGRGIKNGFIEIYTHDIRDYTENRHRKVDDKPYGGGTGMVMQAQPVYDCVMDIISKHEKRPRVIYMSPQGETLTQEKVKELAAEDGLILLCGHYEGIDQRVLDELECGRGHLFAMHIKETQEGVYRDMHFGTGKVDFVPGIRKALDIGVRLFVAECWHDGCEDWKGQIRSVNDFVRSKMPV